MLNVVEPHTQASIEGFVHRLIAGMGVDAAVIAADSQLEDLGLDSLDVVELSQGVKKQLLIRVAPADFAEVRTIADAVSVIARKAGLQ